MDTLTRLAVVTITALFCGTVHACKPPFLEYEVQFERGRAQPPAVEIRRFAEWRIATRASYPAGFQAHVMVWEAPGISRELATERAEYVRAMLLRSGIESSDLQSWQIRGSNDAATTKEGAAFYNRGEIILSPRCPHVCCAAMEPSR